MDKTFAGERILVTGGTGLVGTNLTERLQESEAQVSSFGSEFDLRDPAATAKLFNEVKPTMVFHLAARVGGIYANSTQKSDFYIDNILINTNVVKSSLDLKVPYIFGMGTGCAYPKRLEDVTLHEEDYLDGIPEETNDAYAYAKRSLLVHLEALRSEQQLNYTYCLPANIYGPHDNFHPQFSHVAPGLIRKFVEAKRSNAGSVEVWGDGTAKRDFLHISDCVDAMIELAARRFSGPVNVATGELTTISHLAEVIRSALTFDCQINYNTSFPAGQKHRMFDLSKIESVGWSPKTTLESGIASTCDWFSKHY